MTDTVEEPQDHQQATKDPTKVAAGAASGAARRERRAARGGPLLWTTPEQIHQSLAKVADRLSAGEITARDADSFHKLANGMLGALKVSYTERLEALERQHTEQQQAARDTGVKRRNR